MAWSLALLTAPALLAAAPVPKERSRPLYFPTQVGARWVYADRTSGEVTEEVTDVEDYEGAKLVTVSRRMAPSGRLVVVQRVAVSEKGLREVNTRPPTAAPGLVPGRWLLDFSRTPDRRKVREIPGPWWYAFVGYDEVEVPAGTYWAAKVVPDGGTLSSGAYWYARGVGLVKRTVRSKGKVETVRALKSFTLPGKD